MSGEYLETDVKRLGYFVGSVAAAALVVTAIYWGIFGIKKWTTGVQQGANLMLAASPVPYQGQAPVRTTGSAGQFVCPQHGAVGLPVADAAGVPHCPICNQVMCFNGAQAQAASPQGGSLGLIAMRGG